jgi:hypothetical protein
MGLSEPVIAKTSSVDLIKCPSTQCPASVKKASFGWFQGSFLLWWWVLPIRPVAPGLDRDHPLDYVEKEKRS